MVRSSTTTPGSERSDGLLPTIREDAASNRSIGSSRASDDPARCLCGVRLDGHTPATTTPVCDRDRVSSPESSRSSGIPPRSADCGFAERSYVGSRHGRHPTRAGRLHRTDRVSFPGSESSATRVESTPAPPHLETTRPRLFESDPSHQYLRSRAGSRRAAGLGCATPLG